jgi:hypothetical protein
MVTTKMILNNNKYVKLVCCLISLLIGHSFFHTVEAAEETVWIEAENAVESNFASPGIVVSLNENGQGASAGKNLALWMDKSYFSDHLQPFLARYEFNLVQGGEYRVWLSCSPQDREDFSPLYISIDGSDDVSYAGKKWIGGNYGYVPYEMQGWLEVGLQNLKAGKHSIIVKVKDMAPSHKAYRAYLDALVLTTDKKFKPMGNHPTLSPVPPLTERLKGKTFSQYFGELTTETYYQKYKTTAEEMSGESTEAIVKKIKARPLPTPKEFRDPNMEFGLHTMNFGKSHTDVEKVQEAYELLARVGVDTLRNIDSFWFLLADGVADQKAANFRELDYQITSASKYGMNQMFNVGYPPAVLTKGNHYFSAVKSEYEANYREYIQSVLTRYKQAGVRYLEVGNEVDAPSVWYKNSTPEDYVREVQMVKEEAAKISPDLKIIAFGGLTWSRNESMGGPTEGRRFSEACFKLGIGKYADGYSLHYTWPISEFGFVAWFRGMMKTYGVADKILMDTEQSGYGKPSDIIKMFARDFFVHKFPRVDYYVTKDWVEWGSTVHSGLFDITWRPKQRLLAYAAAVDAMKGRKLVGMATPAPNVEAYVLKATDPEVLKKNPYTLIVWKNDLLAPESLAMTYGVQVKVVPEKIKGLREVQEVVRWNLDRDKDAAGKDSFEITDEPVLFYVKSLPDWKLLSSEEWLKGIEVRARENSAVVPQN